MVAGLFLVERTSQGENDDRNRVRAMVFNTDDAQSDADKLTAAEAALNAANPSDAEPVYPAGYFDSVVQVGATPAGPLATDGDFLAYQRDVVAVRT